MITSPIQPSIADSLRPSINDTRFGVIRHMRGFARKYPGAAALFANARLTADPYPDLQTTRRSSDNGTDTFPAPNMEGNILDYLVPSDVQALYNQRMYFDGTDDYVSGVSLSVSDGESIEFELLPQGVAGSPHVLDGLSTLRISSAYAVRIRISSVNYTFGSSMPEDQINTVRLEKTAGSVQVFLNGTSLGTQSMPDLSFDAVGVVGANFLTGVVSDIQQNDVLKYEGHGITNADWAALTGTGDGTVQGSPDLFTGQGFQGYTTLLKNQGSGGDATQTTAADQPAVVIDGAVQTLGGIPILGDFDGTDDYLRIPYSSAWDAGDKLSVIIVLNSIGATGSILSHYDFGVNKRSWTISRNSNIYRVAFGDPADGTFKGRQDMGSTSSGTKHAFGFTYNAGTVVFYFNGAVTPSSLADGAMPASLFVSDADLLINGMLNSNVAENFIAMEGIAAVVWPGKVIDMPAAMDDINQIFGGAIY